MMEFLPAILSFARYVGRMYASMDLHSGHYLPLDRRHHILKAERIAGNCEQQASLPLPLEPFGDPRLRSHQRERGSHRSSLASRRADPQHLQ